MRSRFNLALLAILLPFTITSCSGQEKTSAKSFPKITLLNRIVFEQKEFDQAKFACAFLLKQGQDTFAVTAKHLMKIIKPDGIKVRSFDGFVKQWSLFPLDNPNQTVQLGKLLNESKSEKLEDKSTYDNDWLLFTIKNNTTTIKPLTIRTTALIPNEKLYVVGWTRKMEGGAQRVYEFEYYKTIGNRILLKEVIVPEQFGGLSGAPLLDEQGLVVGIVSNGTQDPETGKKYFSPCSIQSLVVPKL
ncbi:trypsin-like serine protease [Desertivirga arenae]|uniref:trypsin-like serine protease n=1 Tax=Desertivirga arenae TaxID=2810309 RepID=UPI001A962ED7|nr:trypsin-like serine protease [Pedobacter sp. SYSU D00823]